MGQKADFALIVIWQSFVVAAYRVFFQRLAAAKPGTTVSLVAPEVFAELGFQQVRSEPFADALTRLPNARGHIVKVFAPHTQIVLYRGLGRIFSLFKRDNKQGLPRIVVSISEPYSFTSLWVWAWARFILGRDFSLVLYAAQNIPKKFAWPIARVQSFMFAQAKAVLVLGEEQEKVLRLNGYAGKTIPFPLWFDPERFFPFADKTAAIDRLTAFQPALKSWSRKGLTLGFAGTLNEQKGILDLLAAIKRIDPRYEVSLLIVGDGPLRSQVIELARALSAEGRPTLDLGGLPLEGMPIFYNAIDALIVPSRTMTNVKEQFGRVIIEAMACGALVLGSDSGEVPRVIGRSDRIFREADPEALRKAIESLMELRQDKALWVKAQEECLARAARYSDINLSRKFAEALAEL